MLSNSDCTIYSRTKENGNTAWKRLYIPKVWWYENTKSSITENGIKTGNYVSNILTVRIPGTSAQIKKDDVIVKGNCKTDIKTIKDFSSIEYYKVSGVNYNDFGGNPHIKVVAV